jgi:hypothetical protein
VHTAVEFCRSVNKMVRVEGIRVIRAYGVTQDCWYSIRKGNWDLDRFKWIRVVNKIRGTGFVEYCGYWVFGVFGLIRIIRLIRVI